MRHLFFWQLTAVTPSLILRLSVSQALSPKRFLYIRPCFQSSSFQGVSPFFQLLYILTVGLDMVYRNTVERSTPDPRLEETTNSRSPYIEEMNEDIRQTHNIYHFQNCGTVSMSVDSFNARGVRMENCGNNIPQVTCLYSFSFLFPFHLTWPYYIIKITILVLSTMRTLSIHNLMQSPMVCGHPTPSAVKFVEYYFFL